MDDVSNRTLAIFLVTAIVVSLGATVSVLNFMDRDGLTGRATTDAGNVSLTVATEISIILTSDQVDFGSGFVNTSNAKCANNATLTAAEAGYTDPNDCWTATETPGALRIENDGNVNATETVAGPKPLDFFSGYVGAYQYNLTWKLTDTVESGSCNEPSAGATTYHEFTGAAAQAVCDNMNFQPSNTDMISIDVRVSIPADLDTGVYRNDTIIFTAAQAS